MNITLFNQSCKRSAHRNTQASLRAQWLGIALATALGLSSQNLLAHSHPQLVAHAGLGYSSNSYDYSDNSTDAANASAAGGAFSSEEENGIIANVVLLPSYGHGLGAEMGLQTFSFTGRYADTANNSLAKELDGSLFYLNAIYSFDISIAKLFVKGGVRYSQSTFNAETSGTGLGSAEADTNKIVTDSASQTKIGSGYGAGLLFSPSSSRFGLIVKYENFGNIVQDYDNDQSIVWESSNRLVSSGDLDLSATSITFTYEL